MINIDICLFTKVQSLPNSKYSIPIFYKVFTLNQNIFNYYINIIKNERFRHRQQSNVQS